MKIIFEDKHLIVLSKPAGVLSQGGGSSASKSLNVVDWLREYLKRHYVGLIHRLDRNTSGLMVVAKRSKSANRLSEAMRKKEIQRLYQGWVAGKVTQKQIWEDFLKKEKEKNKVKAITTEQFEALNSQEQKKWKRAITEVAPIQTTSYKQTTLTLCQFQLQTGRSHQIRAQSAFHGFPLLGDHKYNPTTPSFSRPALHAFQIHFPHPMTHENMSFEDPLPDDLETIKKFM